MSSPENARSFVHGLTHPHESLGKPAFSIHYGILKRFSTLSRSPGRITMEYESGFDELRFEPANGEAYPMFWSGILYALVIILFYMLGALPLIYLPDGISTAAQNGSILAEYAIIGSLTYFVLMVLACLYAAYTLRVVVEGEEVW